LVLLATQRWWGDPEIREVMLDYSGFVTELPGETASMLVRKNTTLGLVHVIDQALSLSNSKLMDRVDHTILSGNSIARYRVLTSGLEARTVVVAEFSLSHIWSNHAR
jgi:hypothetical protein